MGSRFAQEIAEYENVELDYQIGIHLQHNHFPPVSLDFVPACIEALRLMAFPAPNDIVTLPNGKEMTAWAVVEGLHLECFVPCDDDADYTGMEW